MAETAEFGSGGDGNNETLKHTYIRNYQRLQTKLLLGPREAFILIGLYNAQRFMDMKILSSFQVRRI